MIWGYVLVSFLSCSQIFEFFWFWLCSMSFSCFLLFSASQCFFGFCNSFLLFFLFAYCFTLLDSLAFRSFTFHSCFLFEQFLLLWLLFVFLLHFFAFSFNCSSGCFDLLSFIASFSLYSLFIFLGCFFLLYFVRNVLSSCCCCCCSSLLHFSFLFEFFWLLFVSVSFPVFEACARRYFFEKDDLVRKRGPLIWKRCPTFCVFGVFFGRVLLRSPRFVRKTLYK